jgi:hypothetical protein
VRASLQGAGVGDAAVVASPPSRPDLTNVLSANTRSDGYAPAGMLSPELSQVAVAQGSTKLENPSPLTSYYGYDNERTSTAADSRLIEPGLNLVRAIGHRDVSSHGHQQVRA